MKFVYLLCYRPDPSFQFRYSVISIFECEERCEKNLRYFISQHPEEFDHYCMIKMEVQS